MSDQRRYYDKAFTLETTRLMTDLEKDASSWRMMKGDPASEIDIPAPLDLMQSIAWNVVLLYSGHGIT